MSRSRDAAARPGIYGQVEAEGYAYALKRANPVATGWLTRIFHEGNGICGERCLSKAVGEAESHSHGYGLRFGAPIWINRAGAKPFSGRGYKTPLFEERTEPLKINT